MAAAKWRPFCLGLNVLSNGLMLSGQNIIIKTNDDPAQGCTYILGLTHWGRDKMAAISQTSILNAFSWMKMYEFHWRFHWGLFPKVPVNSIPSLVQIMIWRRPGASHYLNQWWLAVWYKTKFGSQNFGYQLWCLFLIYVMFSKICSMWV